MPYFLKREAPPLGGASLPSSVIHHAISCSDSKLKSEQMDGMHLAYVLLMVVKSTIDNRFIENGIVIRFTCDLYVTIFIFI